MHSTFRKAFHGLLKIFCSYFYLFSVSNTNFLSFINFTFSYEIEDYLKPYVEPEPDMSDHKRIEALVSLGYNRTDIENSLDSAKYDDVFAIYLLLGRKSTDVSFYLLFLFL